MEITKNQEKHKTNAKSQKYKTKNKKAKGRTITEMLKP